MHRLPATPDLDEVRGLFLRRHPHPFACEFAANQPPGDLLLDVADVPGPTTLLRGGTSDANIATAARLTVRYGKARNCSSARVAVRRANTDERSEVIAEPAADAEARALLIGG